MLRYVIALLTAALLSFPAHAQNVFPAGSTGGPNTPGVALMCVTGGVAKLCDGTTPVQIATLPYPAGATPVTASATGTTAATAATLPGVANKTTYLCGFSIRANATAAVTGNATITGTISGTLNFTQWTAPAASGIGFIEPDMAGRCIPASAVNTAIVATSAAPGTGGVVSVTIWGFQL